MRIHKTIRALYDSVWAYFYTSHDQKDPLLRTLWKGQCPDCGGKEWYDGPRGGMSHNVCCANPDCLSAFNIAPSFFDGDLPFFADRISNHAFKPPESP